jgi:hypothetical protein
VDSKPTGCIARVFERRFARDQGDADAKLIAAAPLMYEALANLENDDGKNMPPSAWKLVQDALQAARGKVE